MRTYNFFDWVSNTAKNLQLLWSQLPKIHTYPRQSSSLVVNLTIRRAYYRQDEDRNDELHKAFDSRSVLHPVYDVRDRPKEDEDDPSH